MGRTESAGTIAAQFAWWAWLALLVAVPITSFPLVEATVGGETVSPLSLIPLLVVLPFAIAPYLLRHGATLPAEIKPLALFVALAVASSAASLALGLEPFKGQTEIIRVFHGVATLAVGVGFLLAAILLPDSDRKLTASLRALYLGALLNFVWCAIQARYVLSGVENVPWSLNQIHRFFSVRDLFRDRITGLAYEPSWLGDQLVVLYLPLWVGSVVTGWSALRRRKGVAWAEILLAALGILALSLSKSRISIVGAVLALSALLVIGIVKAAAWGLAWAVDRVPALPPLRRWSRWATVPPVALVVGLAVAAIALELGSRFDWRIRRIATLPNQIQSLRALYPYELVYAVADRVAFAERVVYWRAGILPFEQHPLLGVGLGNTGLFFTKGLPAYGYRLTEIQLVLDPLNLSFPNAKSLWIRLLAETGILGTSAYLTWMAMLLGASVYLLRQRDRFARSIGTAGLTAVPIWGLEGFSLDTFALPQGWLMFGLVIATAWRRRAAATRLRAGV